VEALDGDVVVVPGGISAAAEVAEHERIAVLDPGDRPDLGGLPALLKRLDRPDDPLPFVHRLGILLTRGPALAGLDADAYAEGAIRLPALARALRPVPVAPSPRPSLSADSEPRPHATSGSTSTGTSTSSSTSSSTSIVLVADAGLPVLEGCLGRLRSHLPHGTEVVVVDPGGDWARSRALRTLRWASVVPGSGVHPVAAGIRAAKGDVVVLLDPAVWVTRRWLEGLIAALGDDPGVVAAGPLVNLGFGHQHAAGVTYRDVPGMETFAEQIRRRSRTGASSTRPTTDVPALLGACVAVRRDALFAVGGFDDAFADPEIAAIDLCLRLTAAGGRLVRADSVFVHLAELPRGTANGRWRFGGGGDLGALRARHGLDADRALPGLVGAVLIVKDEEETLTRALESVSGLIDDVVVCDTGSTDGTLDLLEAMGVRSTSFAWVNDFAAARNASLAEHTGTWGLLLDADETLECADGVAWRRGLAENSADVVFLVCRNLDSSSGGASIDNASQRLLRAADCHWSGRIHEQMVRRDGAPAHPSGSDAARILHDGYAMRRVLDRNKVDRNATLTRLELEDAGRAANLADAIETAESDPVLVDPGTDPGRARFERGRAEMLADSPTAAKEHFLAAIDLLPPHSELLRRMAHCNLAMIANNEGRHDEAIPLAERALDADCTYTQAAVALAIAHWKSGAPGAHVRAREVLEKALRAGNELADPTITRLLLSLRDERALIGDAASMLGALLLDADEPHAAVELLLPLAEQHPTVFEAWEALYQALRVSDDRGWADRLAGLAAEQPGVLEPVLERLPENDRAALLEALAARGVEEWQVSDVERTWRQMQPELRRMSGAAVVAAARQQEADSPELALRLWHLAGDEPYMRIGRARCLDAMGRPEAAAEVIAGVDPTSLDVPDTLFVIVLAAELGDLGLATALLDLLPSDLDEVFAGPARQMRQLLTASG
jgi:tetratricopeptide (TPR) repeat protein